MKLLASYTIYGEPASKKNSKNVGINPYSGRTFVHSSKRFQRWEAQAKAQLRAQMVMKPHTMITVPILVKMSFYKAYDNVPDISNLYEGPQDLLQECGIIENDSQIKGHDGSRIYYMCAHCDKRLKFVRGPNAGKYKEDCGSKKTCPFNRVDIEIFDYPSSQVATMGMFKDRSTLLKQMEQYNPTNTKSPGTKFSF